MANPLIVLLTDFGLRDPYVGVMKGVIKSINPEADIVDLGHEYPKFDIDTAALVLWVSYRYFPRGTIFVCVVDPGVGTSRRALLFVTENYFFIGPDNGCLWSAASSDGIRAVYDISSSPYMLPSPSRTFHGRDLFAPVAAYLSRGVDPDRLGTRVSVEGVVRSWIGYAEVVEGGCFAARIVYVDGFGNLMTNIHVSSITGWAYGGKVRVEYNGASLEVPFERSFGYVGWGELVCYINSWGFLEIGVNQGSAAERLGLSKGSRVKVCWVG